MDFNKVDYKELLEDSFQLYNNPDNKSTTLQDIGVQFDCNDTTKNSPKDIKNRFVEPSVVPQVFVNEYEENIDNTWDSLENAKFAHINSVITRDNFYDSTACDWKEVKSHPEGKPDYESDSGSKYWYTDNGVYRESDHWGFGVGSCDWTLNENPELSWRDNEKVRVGYADFKDFKNTEGKSFPQIFEMLTPKEAGLEDTDQNGDIYYFNYRTNDLENKNNFVDDKLYPASIETRLYTECASEGADTSQPSSVTNKVNENVVDNVSNSVVNQVGGQSGTPRNYGSKKPGATSLKNYAFELTTIEKIAEEIVVEADLESKKPYLLKDLEKSKFDKKDYDQIIDICNDMDPTGKKAVFTQWILRRHALDGEEFSGVESSDYLQKFLELKKSKKLQNADADINHYKSFADLKEKVDQVLEETGGYTSKRKEEKSNTEDGIQKIDQDGDIELYVVNTQEAAAKEFRSTSWCVKDPKWFNDYAKDDKNFYYFKKDGKPYLLLHTKDFRTVSDGTPSDRDFYNIRNLFTRNNLQEVDSEIAIELLLMNEFDNKDYYNTLLNNVSDGEDAWKLLSEEIVTKYDNPEVFNKIIKTLIDDGDSTGALVYGKLDRESNPELFDKLVYQSINNGDAVVLLSKKIVTRDNGDIFFDCVDASIRSGRSYESLIKGYITKEDGDVYDTAIKDAISRGYTKHLYHNKLLSVDDLDKYASLISGDVSYDLINSNIVLPDDSVYKKLIMNIINGTYLIEDLIYNRILTFKDLFWLREEEDSCKNRNSLYNVFYRLGDYANLENRPEYLDYLISNDYLVNGFQYGLQNMSDELYDKLIQMNDKRVLGYMLAYRVLTRDRSPELYGTLTEEIMGMGNTYKLITSGAVKPEDGDFYKECLRRSVQDGYNAIRKLVNNDIISASMDQEYKDVVIDQAKKSGELDLLLQLDIITEDEWKNLRKINENSSEDSNTEQNTEPMDESAKDDTTKESAFEFTDINKLADLYGDSDRGDEIPESQNKFLNSLPVSEVDKDQKQKLMDEAKKVNKVINYIPKSLNYPFIEDEMAGNVLFFSETDFMEDLFNN
jgi:hypothetical protein